MRDRVLRPSWKPFIVALIALLFLANTAWAQQAPATSAEHESKAAPVVRTFGAEGGYRTEVKSQTEGTLGQEDRRQVSLLAAQVFQHVDEARRALDADDTKQARKEVDKGREALKAVRALLPRTSVRTRTEAPDGQVIYEDRREVQEDRVPLFEGMLHAQTLAPIVEAQRDASEAAEVKGVRLVGSESIRTEAVADLGVVEGQLRRAAKALEEHKPAEAAQALAMAQVRGVDFRFNKEDSPLAEARDAIWLARRSLEENNVEQARSNLVAARQRLRIYREIAPKERQADVDRMLKEAGELEGQLHKETAQNPASQSDRARQGSTVTRWWEQINGWFKKHF
jgi:hypothetical protein